MIRSILSRGTVVALLVVALTGVATAEEAVDSTIAAGKTRFMNNCAVCHGEDGKGAGIVAGHLDKAPADLTQLTKKNNGHFPFKQIYRTIDGRQQIGAHGSREMPIWGAEFRLGVTTAAGTSESVVRGKILELIVFIQSIQE